MHYNEAGISFSAKIEFLHQDGSTAYEITDDVIKNGSSINISNESGTRRTATVTVDNWKNTYDNYKNRFFFNQLVRLSIGVTYSNGDTEWFPQGVFYISNTSMIFNPSERTTTFELVDKSLYLQRSAFPGNVKFAPGDDLIDWVKSVLKLDKGNGYQFDSMPPIFDNAFYTQSYQHESKNSEGQQELKTYYYYQCPEDESFTGQYSDVLDKVSTLMFAKWGYDANGHLRFDSFSGDTKSSELNKPILWNFNTDNSIISSLEYSVDQKNMYNHVVVTGAVVDGKLMRGEALDDDSQSAMNYKVIGKVTYFEQNKQLYADSLCEEYAKFLLGQYKKIAESITITCPLLPHLREDCIITVQRDGVDSDRIPYLITGMSMPLSETEQMTITASRIDAPISYVEASSISSGFGFPLGNYYLNTLY